MLRYVASFNWHKKLATIHWWVSVSNLHSCSNQCSIVCGCIAHFLSVQPCLSPIKKKERERESLIAQVHHDYYTIMLLNITFVCVGRRSPWGNFSNIIHCQLQSWTIGFPPISWCCKTPNQMAILSNPGAMKLREHFFNCSFSFFNLFISRSIHQSN